MGRKDKDIERVNQKLYFPLVVALRSAIESDPEIFRASQLLLLEGFAIHQLQIAASLTTKGQSPLENYAVLKQTLQITLNLDITPQIKH